MSNNEPTNQEILEAINEFATNTDQRFNKVEKDLTYVKATMVTKDYLDGKLADLRGDLVVLMRKEDTKLKTLVDVLCEKKNINDKDKKKIFKMEPFAELTV